MLRLSPVAGLQSGIVALIISSSAIAILQPTVTNSTEAAQDEIAAPADKSSMEKFMVRKLAACQRALEGVAREDFELIRKSTAEMIDLSRHEAWERMASSRFVQDTTDFVSAAEFLDRMAASNDAEGVSLGFVRLTLACANCHTHVRSSRVAKTDTPERDFDAELLALLRPK